MRPQAKPTRRRRGSTVQLPPEICAKICESLSLKDRVTLCRTSRLLADQAQRLIYRTVDLSHSTPLALRSWCLAVTRHSQLAEHVHVLSMGLPIDLSFSSDVGKIARALSRCVNLKELSIHPDNSGPFGALYESQSSSIQGWIITKCPFRLTKFSNSYFRNSFISQFWTPQSEIRVLAIPNCTHNFPIYDDQLPHLIALEVGDVRSLPVGRALQRIQLRWGRYTAGSVEQLSALSRYSATLMTLNLLQTSVTPLVSTLRIFDKVAQELPLLLHLGITEIDKYTKDRFAEDAPLNVLAKFTQLQTFVIYCQKINAFRDLALARVYQLDEMPGLEAFGRAVMEACPTLRRVDVGAPVFSATDMEGWNPQLRRKELACALTRTATGDIEVECGTRFNFHAVAMFWNA
ncbi:hypothetical protein DFH07DRAFT_95782 [Mycena maculata]|uniref:F-box domain-containing protein n=1 Tax=Mycena maculata TaxID=230809 RepID=A0AAD7I813_9AGAR|nr:hypothetical protein DFH07DRAFT_95782 [Mycena maculata]